MSFIDVNKLVDQAAEKIVLKVSQNLTDQADQFVEGIKHELSSSIDKATGDIVNGFDLISAQLELQMKIIYVLLALLIFVFFCCGYGAVIYLLNAINTPPRVLKPQEGDVKHHQSNLDDRVDLQGDTHCDHKAPF